MSRNDWICPLYVTQRSEQLMGAFTEHLSITLVAVLAGVVFALPVAVLARRSAWLSTGVVSVGTIVYTIPSVALFSLIYAFSGLSPTTVTIGLALYSLAILLSNTLDGLAAVPADAVDAARGMGYGPWRLLVAVELPLALPTILAGVRIATVSTVALVTVGTVVGFGGFGDLIATGFRANFKAEVLTASVATVLLALVLDGVLLAVQRIATPWSRRRSA